MSAHVTALAKQIADELATIAQALDAINLDGLLIPRELVGALNRARTVARLAGPRAVALHTAAVADEGGHAMRKLVEWLIREKGRAVEIEHVDAVWTASLRGFSASMPAGAADLPVEVTARKRPGLGNAVEDALALWTDLEHPQEDRPWPWSE